MSGESEIMLALLAGTHQEATTFLGCTSLRSWYYSLRPTIYCAGTVKRACEYHATVYQEVETVLDYRAILGAGFRSW